MQMVFGALSRLETRERNIFVTPAADVRHTKSCNSGTADVAFATIAMSRIETAFLFDLDGTLIDSVYQHVLAWREALDQEGINLSVWRIHRRIGMSGGLFTNMLLRETGLEISAERVERLRQLHAEAFVRLCHQVRALPGARELLGYLMTWVF